MNKFDPVAAMQLLEMELGMYTDFIKNPVLRLRHLKEARKEIQKYADGAEIPAWLAPLNDLKGCTGDAALQKARQNLTHSIQYFNAQHVIFPQQCLNAVARDVNALIALEEDLMKSAGSNSDAIRAALL